MASVDQQLAERFRCSKCGAQQGATQRFSASGTGLSKLFDIQYKQFIVASCQNCGYAELYNPAVLEGKRNLSTVLDVLFG